MIKARAAAGDAALAAAFVAGVEPFVYPAQLEPAAIDDVRRTKVRLEEYIRARGKEFIEVKRGRGGIRDVEFAVQLLQIVHGRSNERLRNPGTLPALAALADEGYVARDDAAVLADAYRFLRRLEHRLQMVRDLQTHDLPDRSGGAHHARALARARGRGGAAGRIRPHDRAGPPAPRAALLPPAARGVRGAGVTPGRARPGCDRGTAGGPRVRPARTRLRPAPRPRRAHPPDRHGARLHGAGAGAGARAGAGPRRGARAARTDRRRDRRRPRSRRRTRARPGRCATARVGRRRERGRDRPAGAGLLPRVRPDRAATGARDRPTGRPRPRDRGSTRRATPPRARPARRSPRSPTGWSPPPSRVRSPPCRSP